MSGNYTPGPWTTEEAPGRAWIAGVGHDVEDPQIWTVRQCAPGDRYHFGDKDADARLMAESPAMHALLREIIDLCALGDVDESTEAYGWGKTIREVKAVLARIEGPA